MESLDVGGDHREHVAVIRQLLGIVFVHTAEHDALVEDEHVRRRMPLCHERIDSEVELTSTEAHVHVFEVLLCDNPRAWGWLFDTLEQCLASKNLDTLRHASVTHLVDPSLVRVGPRLILPSLELVA